MLLWLLPGTNPVQLTRGMDKTVAALVKELAKLSTEVASDKDLSNVAAVSAGRGSSPGPTGDGREGSSSHSTVVIYLTVCYARSPQSSS